MLRGQPVLLSHGVVRRLCDPKAAWQLNNGQLFRSWAHDASSFSSPSFSFTSVSATTPPESPAEGSRQLTPEALQRLLLLHLKEARSCPKASNLAAGVSRCDRRAISSSITLCESTNPAHHPTAARLLHLLSEEVAGAGAGAAAAPSGRRSSSGTRKGRARRLGISGPPGAGKSSLIEAVGTRVLEQERVAVLAIDPTSRFSGGAILGDKTRMPLLGLSENAYVRPSPTRGSLGGVTRSTADAVAILEAAGFSQILIETVGVGQSETAVSDMVDCVLLVLPPAGGDDLQAMKRGIMEVADIIVVNKADGDTEAAAERSAHQHRMSIDLLPRRWASWAPQVVAVSTHSGRGLSELLQLVDEFYASVAAGEELQAHRRQQDRHAALLSMQQIVLERLQADRAARSFLDECFGGTGPSEGLAARCIAQLAAESFLGSHWSPGAKS